MSQIQTVTPSTRALPYPIEMQRDAVIEAAESLVHLLNALEVAPRGAFDTNIHARCEQLLHNARDLIEHGLLAIHDTEYHA